MINETVRKFIDVFFGLQDLVVISYGEFNQVALGIVTGKDEKIDDVIEHLYFIWYIDKANEELIDIVTLSEFLKVHNLVDGDRILIEERNLVQTIKINNWNVVKIHKVLTDLLSIDIKMVHDGEVSDSFFLHF